MTKRLKFNLIVAMCKNNGIGLNGKLPWSIKEDLAFFSKTTIGQKNNAVIMGRKTWESLPSKFQKTGLPFRDNFILSSKLEITTNDNSKINNIIKSFVNITKLIDYLQDSSNKVYDELWVIGGSELYKSFLEQDLIDKCVITFINKDYESDTILEGILPSGTPNYSLLEKRFELINSIPLIENVIIKEYIRSR
jgi:dihydrofolate reductase